MGDCRRLLDILEFCLLETDECLFESIVVCVEFATCGFVVVRFPVGSDVVVVDFATREVEVMLWGGEFAPTLHGAS